MKISELMGSPNNLNEAKVEPKHTPAMQRILETIDNEQGWQEFPDANAALEYCRRLVQD